jgi:protease-4
VTYTRPTRLLAAGRCGTAALVFLAALAAALTGCQGTSFLITPVRVTQGLEERVIIRESAWATNKIALIDVDGVLENKRERMVVTGARGENPVALFKEKLDKAARDQRVRAVVVRINSPGGTVTASDLMHTELRNFRARTDKPVVASMLDVAASGGYYLACAADRIFAHPTTITGSIGVVMLLPEFSGTMQKLGIGMRTFKSGDMKDAGSIFREMTPEERAVFQRLIMGMYERFLAVVRQGRPDLPPERLVALADGRVYLGPEAREHGLVDDIGTIQDALLAAKEAAGLADKKVLVVQYGRPLSHRPNVYARGSEPAPQVNVVNLNLPDWLSDPSPRLMYLWAPGW